MNSKELALLRLVQEKDGDPFLSKSRQLGMCILKMRLSQKS